MYTQGVYSHTDIPPPAARLPLPSLASSSCRSSAAAECLLPSQLHHRPRSAGDLRPVRTGEELDAVSQGLELPRSQGREGRGATRAGEGRICFVGERAGRAASGRRGGEMTVREGLIVIDGV
eukprot:768661-Hanusia_phi.AAC.4